MPAQTILWTAVPNGVSGDTARLVVVVSPRLTDASRTRVSQWPDWTNWAERAAKFTFSVEPGGGVPVAATVVSPPPDPRRWAAAVLGELPVRPYVPVRHQDRKIRSYPAANVADFIKSTYLDTALNSPTAFPSIETHVHGLAQVGLLFNERTEKALRDRLAAAREAGKAVPPGPAAPVSDFVEVVQFHEVEAGVRRMPRASLVPDFHQLLTFLTQYPALQRYLGVAFDLTVPLKSLSGATTVRVVPTWTPSLTDTANVSPWTRVQVAAGKFAAAPRSGSDLDADRLALGSAAFRVVTVDTDGGAIKGRQFADGLRRAAVTKSTDTPTSASLPALRSGGIGVVRTGRAVQQVQRFAAAAGLEPPTGSVTLDADALLQGLRWAVYDVASHRWYSLCERRGSYAFLRDRGLDLDLTDAGTVSTAVTQRGDTAAADYYLSEFLVRWQGQSLVAPRKGRSLDPDPAGSPVDDGDVPPATIPLQVRMAPRAGSLPPLRYGRRYRLQAKASYLGGAGPGFDSGDTDFAHATAEITYGRLEPAPPPVVALRGTRVPGETLHHLVIRSDGSGTTPPTERHILPPKGAQDLLEAHGVFDTPAGMDRTAFPAIVARAGGSLGSAGTADPADPDQIILDTDRLGFPVENGGTAEVPWLVDPIARGAAFVGLPNTPLGMASVGYGYESGATWRTARPFRLRVVAGDAAPAFDAGARVLTVSLAPGEVADVSLASLLADADLQLLEIYRWLQEAAPAPQLGTHKQYALTGRHWLLTPAQPLTLVHAVRRPVVRPAFRTATAQRVLGSTVSTLRADNLLLSRRSTVELDIRADWTDPVDTLDASGWQPRRPVSRSAVAGSVPVAVADAVHDDASLDLTIAHSLGDTLAHTVSYTAVAKSRFAEHFPETTTATVVLAGDAPVPVDPRGAAAGSETVQAGGTTYVPGKDYDVTLDGQLRRLPGGAIAAGTAVGVTFRASVSLASEPIRVTVPGAARPAAPKPAYVVPTFGWSNTADAAGTSSTRRGGGLRVYLDRPWWSSGDGEALAVVLWPTPGSATRVDAALAPYVTAWGSDPLYLTGELPSLVPALGDFTAATARVSGLRLAETDTVVSAAIHDVSPNLDRQLWFSDIELSPGRAHQPFVRLALARYQPSALPGAELSHVVLADFAQLAPDRTATVTFGSTPGTVRVAVNGSGYARSADGLALGSVEVTVEVREDGVPGDLGWVAAGPQLPLTGTPVSTGDVLWRGSVTLAGPRGQTAQRLVIREYESFGDRRRLLYTDVLPL